jgi:hypothetical protein
MKIIFIYPLEPNPSILNMFEKFVFTESFF